MVARRRFTPRYVQRPGHDGLPKTAKYGAGELPGMFAFGNRFQNVFQKIRAFKVVFSLGMDFPNGIQ